MDMSAFPKNSGKAPSMQWYPADWRQDNGVQALSYHDRGVWFEMINIMHASSERGVLSINGVAMSQEMIARLLGLDNQTFNQTLTNLLTYGVAKRREEDGAIFCKRMVHDESISQLRRESGRLGGNPSLLNQNPNQKPTTGVKQIPTPSPSTSASTPIGIEVGSVCARPTLAEAISAGTMSGLSAAESEAWWNAREASDWMKGAGGGATTPVGTNWRADQKSFTENKRERDRKDAAKPGKFDKPATSLPPIENKWKLPTRPDPQTQPGLTPAPIAANQ